MSVPTTRAFENAVYYEPPTSPHLPPDKTIGLQASLDIELWNLEA